MKTKVWSLLVVFMFGAVSAFAALKTDRFEVKGNSEECKIHIEDAAKSVDGVTRADWNQEEQILEVDYDDSVTDLDKIEIALANAGHDTPNHVAKDEAYNQLPDDCKTRENDEMNNSFKLDDEQ